MSCVKETLVFILKRNMRTRKTCVILISRFSRFHRVTSTYCQLKSKGGIKLLIAQLEEWNDVTAYFMIGIVETLEMFRFQKYARN